MSKRDEYARAVLRAGRDLAVSPRGIVIGFATVSVESSWLMWANRADPASLSFPHDRVGSDANSVGLFQQRAPWWGTVAQRMDPYHSARMFFEELKKLPYNDNSRSPGWYAQQVQKSAYPDRYDQRMREAQALYDRLAGAPNDAPNPGGNMPDYGITKRMHGYNPRSIGIGNSDGPRSRTLYVVQHTQEAQSTAVNLANYCNNSWNTGNPVSYNLVVDDEDTIEVVPVGEAPWSAAEANPIGLHICFAGSFAGWSAGKWLSTDTSDGLNEDAMLWRGAKATAAACAEFGIPAVFAGDGGRSGWPVLPKGICGHRDFGRRGGGHTDPGGGFPMTEFVRRVNTFLNPTEEDIMAALSDAEQRELLDGVRYIRNQLGPKLPAWGEDSSLGKNAKSQERTLRDAFAALLRKSGV